jgi:hypothetical protein
MCASHFSPIQGKYLVKWFVISYIFPFKYKLLLQLLIKEHSGKYIGTGRQSIQGQENYFERILISQIQFEGITEEVDEDHGHPSESVDSNIYDMTQVKLFL